MQSLALTTTWTCLKINSCRGAFFAVFFCTLTSTLCLFVHTRAFCVISTHTSVLCLFVHTRAFCVFCTRIWCVVILNTHSLSSCVYVSVVMTLIADEICLLASNPYDAGQRSLWHLDKIGSLVDCSVSKSLALGPDLELVYAVPAAVPRKPSSTTSGLFDVIDLVESSSPRNFFSKESSSSSRFLRITEHTRVKFIHPVSVVVFSLDLSPSMNVIDTSFKSLTTGCHLVDNLVASLALALRCLVDSPTIHPGITFPVQPKFFATVIAHGVPGSGPFPLLVAERVTVATIPEIIRKLGQKIKRPIRVLSHWLQANHVQEQLGGVTNCSRTRAACTSAVCQANDVTVVVRDSLTALSMTCSQLCVSKAAVNKSILILTDGVLAHPRRLPYDNILMHLNFIDVAMHILQIGGGFAPWSALGYASDPDLLRLLAASTPTGLFIQDHHLDVILKGSISQLHGKGLFGPTPNLQANVLWKAGSLKFSCFANKRKSADHMPYKSLTYQSSLLSTRSSNGAGVNTYIDHIHASSMSRNLHAIELQGIVPQRSEEYYGDMNAFTVRDESSLIRTRVDSTSSFNAASDVSSDAEDEPQSMRSYLQPERTKARPYLYKQYTLPGVSAAQLIQIRAREGFLIEGAGNVGVGSSSSANTLVRVASGTLPRSPSVNTLAGEPVRSLRADGSVSFSMSWGPVMDIIYQVSSGGCEDDGGDAPGYVSRSSEELGIRIYLRMPSGDFFLKFKQHVTVSTETYFGQMCRQMDKFIESIFTVDDTLTKMSSNYRSGNRHSTFRRASMNKITEVADSQDFGGLVDVVPRDVATWHRWFTVRTMYVLLDVSGQVADKRIRHGMFAPLLGTAREGLLADIAKFAPVELTAGKLFMCRDFTGWPGVCAAKVNSHTANTLCRSNDTVLARLAGDVRLRSATDEISPFCVIEVLETVQVHGVIKLSLGFFAMCPQMERQVVEEIGRRLTGNAVLLHTPSPIIRELVVKHGKTGRFSAGKSSHMMGGESFYTYSPDPVLVNQFMLHHSWDLPCPPASVHADILSRIHDERIKDGWKCVYETTSSIVYAKFTQNFSQSSGSLAFPNSVSNDTNQKLWIPNHDDEPTRTPQRSTPNMEHYERKELLVDWNKLLQKQNSQQNPPPYVRGMCTCIHVQHSQVRGEKPVLKCQVWADRSHPQWQKSAEFRAFCNSLISLE